MQVTEKKLENATIEFEIVVPENRVEVEYKSVFNRLQKSVKVDGFRKGKAPLNVVENKFNEKADANVADNLLRSILLEVIEDKKHRPLSEPQFDFSGIERGREFSFKVKFEVAPTVELSGYKKLNVEEMKCVIKDKDIIDEIDALRERNAEISKKDENEKAQDGDLVKIKLKRIDDVSGDEIGQRDFKEYSISLGKSKSEFSFDKDIVGMKVNEEKEVVIKYPKKYEVQDLAGQKVTYLVNIAEISKMILPDADDEFAKDLGEYETLDELKKGIRENLENYIADKSSSETKSKLIKEIVEKSSFDLPESMITGEMEAVFRRIQQKYGYHSNNINEFAAAMGIDTDKFSGQLRTEAAYNIKSMLVLSEIAKKDDLKADDEKYRKMVENLAKKNNKSIEEIEKLIEKSNSRGSIESELILDEAMELIYNSANIKKNKPIPFQEFMKAGQGQS